MKSELAAVIESSIPISGSPVWRTGDGRLGVKMLEMRWGPDLLISASFSAQAAKWKGWRSAICGEIEQGSAARLDRARGEDSNAYWAIGFNCLGPRRKMRISMSAPWSDALCLDTIDGYPFDVAEVRISVVCGMKSMEMESMMAVRKRLFWIFLMQLVNQMRRCDRERVVAPEPRVPIEVGGRVIADIVQGPLLQRHLIGRSVVQGNCGNSRVNLISGIGLPGNFLPYGNCMFAWGVVPEGVFVCTENASVSSIEANLRVVEEGYTSNAKVLVLTERQEFVGPTLLFTYGQQVIWGNWDVVGMPEDATNWDTQAAVLMSAFYSHFIESELQRLWLLICERGFATVLHALVLMSAEGAFAIRQDRVLSEALSLVIRTNCQQLLIVDAYKRNGDVVSF